MLLAREILFALPTLALQCGTRLRNCKQFPTGGMEHEFLKVIIIQIESIAAWLAWLSYEGVCFLFNYGLAGQLGGGVATVHDEIGSGLSGAMRG